MTHNPFEKQIADKLNQYEVQPGDGMLDSIFEKRASRRTPLMRLSRLGLVAAVVTVAVSALYVYNNYTGGAKDPSPGSGPQVAVESDQAPAVPVESPEANNSTQPDIQPSTGSAERSHASAPAVDRPASVKNYSAERGGKSVQDRSGSPASTASLASGKNGADGNGRTDRGKNSGKFAGDNGDNIYNRYFNIHSKDRPVIERSEHQGNSHLFVYQSISEKILDAYTFIPMSTRPLSKFANVYDLASGDKLAQPEIKTKKVSRTGRKPLFVDLLYVPVLSKSYATGNSDVQDHANSIRKNSFNSQYGVRVSLPISDRISVFSGLFYQEQSSVYKGTINREEPVTRINTIETYINDPVTMNIIKVTTYDTIEAMENRATGYHFRNTYKLFQLPLGLSYNFGYRKFDFALNASALVNMFTNSGGHAMNIAERNTNAFSSSGKYLGMGAGLSFMSALQVSPRFRLILEPGVQCFKVNAIKAGNNINERIFNKQLTIGLRYSVF